MENMDKGTGACGVNCLVCGLFRQGKCSPCGGGHEAQAQKKLAAQLQLLGGVCPILNCAVSRKVPYCSADCRDYPCPHFEDGNYPFSAGYLNMQRRRRGQQPAQPKQGHSCGCGCGHDHNHGQDPETGKKVH